jgi:hypothetical protein
MPTAKSGMSEMKVQAFETFLLQNDMEDLMGKIDKVLMPELNSQAQGVRYLEEQLWGSLGDLIRQKLKEERG